MAAVWISEHSACAALLLLLAHLPVSAAEETLTLVSWNIEHLAAQDSKGCRARDDAEYQAIRRYLEQIDADVVAFQEVENEHAAARIFPAGDYDIHISNRPTRKFSKCYDGPNHRLMQRTGFAVRKDIGTRLGLKAVRQADVRDLEGAYDSGRWGVYLVLQQAGAERSTPTPARAPLHLLSIHLKSRCTYQSIGAGKTNANCRLLQAQIEALSDWVRTRAAAGQDFIIAGDFNRQLDQLSDEVWLRLESGGGNAYVDLEKALHGIQHPQPYNRKYPFAIDHVIYNQPLDALAIEEKTYFDTRAAQHSDHLPLISVFGMVPGERDRMRGLPD